MNQSRILNQSRIFVSPSKYISGYKALQNLEVYLDVSLGDLAYKYITNPDQTNNTEKEVPKRGYFIIVDGNSIVYDMVIPQLKVAFDKY